MLLTLLSSFLYNIQYITQILKKAMLYLVRKLDEGITIDGDIRIKVIELKRNSVKLGIKSSGSHSILRDEIYNAIENESGEHKVREVKQIAQVNA